MSIVICKGEYCEHFRSERCEYNKDVKDKQVVVEGWKVCDLNEDELNNITYMRIDESMRELIRLGALTEQEVLKISKLPTVV